MFSVARFPHLCTIRNSSCSTRPPQRAQREFASLARKSSSRLLAGQPSAGAAAAAQRRRPPVEPGVVDRLDDLVAVAVRVWRFGKAAVRLGLLPNPLRLDATPLARWIGRAQVAQVRRHRRVAWPLLQRPGMFRPYVSQPPETTRNVSFATIKDAKPGEPRIAKPPRAQATL